MMDEQAASVSRPASARSWSRLSGLPGRWAALGGSAAVLVLASLMADGMAFGAKQACRAGAWNFGVEQYQAHCYTDIYPLYFGEGLTRQGSLP